MVFYRIFFATLVKKTFSFLVIFLLLLPLLSCGLKKQATIYPDFSASEYSASSLGWIGEDDILSVLAKIDFHTVDGYYPAKAALNIKRPSYLRLELLPVIGVPDFLLTATPEKMNIFIPSRGEFYSGRPTGSNLKKFLPWPIEIEDMVMILTGTYPSFKEKSISYQADRKENILRVEMKAPSGRSHIIWVSEKNKLLKLIHKDETGKELYNVKYIYDADSNDLPEKIIITMGDGKTALSVKYSHVKIEKSADLSVFNLEIPSNIKSIIME